MYNVLLEKRLFKKLNNIYLKKLQPNKIWRNNNGRSNRCKRNVLYGI